MINTAQNNSYINELQKLSEDDFSKNILIPLLKGMGYSRAEFYGGVLEQGKDVIAYKENLLLDEEELTVFQSKKIGKNHKAKNNAVISELISQLRKCFSKEINTYNGKKAYPQHVFLATPYQITSRFMDHINEELNIPGAKINVLDGPRIIHLLEQHNKKLLKTLAPFKQFTDIDFSQLKNIELGAALKQKSNLNIVDCYSDLNFFVGSANNSVLLNSQIKIDAKEIKLEYDEWKNYKEEFLPRVNQNLDFNLLNESIEYIDDEYDKQQRQYTSEENLRLRKKLITLKQKFNITFLKCTQIIKEKRDQLEDFFEKGTHLENAKDHELISKILNTIDQKIKRYEDASVSRIELNKLSSLLEEIHGIPLNVKASYKDLTVLIDLLIYSCKDLTAVISKYVERPFVKISINEHKLLEFLEGRKTIYKKGLSEVNDGKYSDQSILKFLDETEKTLSIINTFIKADNQITKCISIKKPNLLKNDVVKLTAKQIFDSGKDIAVYGGAGAGKTTTLQVYCVDKAKSSEIVIYLPLNRVVIAYKKLIEAELAKNETPIENEDNSKLLLTLVLLSQKMHLTDENYKLTEEQLKSVKSFQIVLDGVDEAHNSINGLLKSLDAFKLRFPNSQIIMSSRDCVSYLKEITFLGITLLPFTKIQLEYFIKGWFTNNKKANKLIATIYEKEIFDIIKTPLLAAVLCNFVDCELEIPATEYEIYSKRLSLFCGEYDRHKEVSRTTLPQDVLEKIATLVAYKFHAIGTRSADKDTVVEYICNDPSFRYKQEVATTAVNELIEVCNVLVVDPLTDQLSFGHLRYQEHLASMRITNDRSIDIIPILHLDWWRGVMQLYAHNCSDVCSLIEDTYHKKTFIGPCHDTFIAMASARPVSERIIIYDLIKRYLKQEPMEIDYLDIEHESFPSISDIDPLFRN